MQHACCNKHTKRMQKKAKSNHFKSKTCVLCLQGNTRRGGREGGVRAASSECMASARRIPVRLSDQRKLWRDQAQKSGASTNPHTVPLWAPPHTVVCNRRPIPPDPASSFFLQPFSAGPQLPLAAVVELPQRRRMCQRMPQATGKSSHSSNQILPQSMMMRSLRRGSNPFEMATRQNK
jgi:hypothetical protein